MTIRLCKCGKTSTGNPTRSAMQVRWLCDACVKGARRDTRNIVEQRHNSLDDLARVVERKTQQT